MPKASRAPLNQAKRYPNGHRLSVADYRRGHIHCVACDRPAMYCEYNVYALSTRPTTRGISFWYYCDKCWGVPGPMGTTPKQRATAG